MGKKPATTKKTRARKNKTFPTMPLKEALVIAKTIEAEASGTPMKRLTLFDTLGKSPDSGPSRALITASSKYGLTNGSYKADDISLTDLGKKIVSESSSPRERTRAMWSAGIDRIEPFSAIHSKFVNNKLPSESVLRDFLKDEADVDENDVQECIDTFIVNAKDSGILREMSGAERLLPVDHVVDELPAARIATTARIDSESSAAASVAEATESASTDWLNTCFYITPIGEEHSDLRKHSDLFLEHIVEPALTKLELKVVRADKIGRPGMITRKVLEYVLRSRLAVADLSYHNPNVFYELSLRHACGLPSLLIIRQRDKIPFDLKDFDTITIDDSDIYTLIPKLEVYKSQLASQARSAIEDDATIDNPIRTYFPGLQVTIPEN